MLMKKNRTVNSRTIDSRLGSHKLIEVCQKYPFVQLRQNNGVENKLIFFCIKMSSYTPLRNGIARDLSKVLFY